jgi:hypothetical protein
MARQAIATAKQLIFVVIVCDAAYMSGQLVRIADGANGRPEG